MMKVFGDAAPKNGAMSLFMALLCLYLHGTAGAQPVRAHLQLEADSVVLGMPMKLRMQLTHPPGVWVGFPQKQDFEDFELVSRGLEESRQQGDSIIHSMEFWVRSFDIAPFQSVVLPYFYSQGNDTLQAYLQSDSLPFASRITDNPPTFRPHGELIPLQDPGSHLRLLLFWLAGLLMLMALLWILRKPLRRWWKLQALRREYRHILAQLQAIQAGAAHQAHCLYRLNQLWKSYADRQGSLGLKSFTTTELQAEMQQLPLLNTPSLPRLLQMVHKSDMAIYAGKKLRKKEIEQFIQLVQQYIEELYQAYRNELTV